VRLWARTTSDYCKGVYPHVEHDLLAILPDATDAGGFARAHRHGCAAPIASAGSAAAIALARIS
jgi:hypothetical protein